MDDALLKDIIGWDVGNWSDVLRFWEGEIPYDHYNRLCLEIGANKGGLALWLALRGYRVICSDLVDTKKRALPLHEKYGVESLIRYEDIDATNIPYTNAFDIIVFKSMLGGIGARSGHAGQSTAMAEIQSALRSGGKLLFAENMTASSLHRFLRRRYVAWGKTWKYLTMAEMTDFLQPYSSFRIQTTGVVGVLGRTERAKRLMAVVDHAILNRVVPANWKYVGYGIATK